MPVASSNKPPPPVVVVDAPDETLLLAALLLLLLLLELLDKAGASVIWLGAFWLLVAGREVSADLDVSAGLDVSADLDWDCVFVAGGGGGLLPWAKTTGAAMRKRPMRPAEGRMAAMRSREAMQEVVEGNRTKGVGGLKDLGRGRWRCRVLSPQSRSL